MDEREELLAQLHQLRRLVLALTPYHPTFSVQQSRLLDWVDQTIERLEHRT